MFSPHYRGIFGKPITGPSSQIPGQTGQPGQSKNAMVGQTSRHAPQLSHLLWVTVKFSSIAP
jgi:hypothetical protein